MRHKLGLRVALVEFLAGKARQALGGELRAIIRGPRQGHAFLRGQGVKLVVHAGVFLNHLLAELLQLRVGGPLFSELAQRQLGQSAVGGRGGKEPVVDDGLLSAALRLVLNRIGLLRPARLPRFGAVAVGLPSWPRTRPRD